LDHIVSSFMRLIVLSRLMFMWSVIATKPGKNFAMIEIQITQAQNVSVTHDELIVTLSDGRTISAPLAWYPRLWHGTMAERNNWRLIGKGEGIHWEDLDEDISVEGLLLGRPSSESQRSLAEWLEERASHVE
jgi:hypothetical protein